MTSRRPPGLGTLLRHLVDLLDQDVAEAYRAAGLNYRPRYTPVLRAVLELDDASIRAIAGHAQLTHSAASQTVAQMVRAGLVRIRAGKDARERVARLSPRAVAMLPQLRRVWDATRTAQGRFEAELAYPLSELLQEAIAALGREPFRHRYSRRTQ
ncbi:MAG: MarR family winged helix-turn-helix transcriptional regulator [Gemmatimonadales bacterium]